jgi:hypothetical protein
MKNPKMTPKLAKKINELLKEFRCGCGSEDFHQSDKELTDEEEAAGGRELPCIFPLIPELHLKKPIKGTEEDKSAVKKGTDAEADAGS